MERRQHKESSHVEDSIYSISAGSKPIWHTHTKRHKGKNEPKQELKIYKYEGGFRNIKTYDADVRAIILIQDAQIGQNTIQTLLEAKMWSTDENNLNRNDFSMTSLRPLFHLKIS